MRTRTRGYDSRGNAIDREPDLSTARTIRTLAAAAPFRRCSSSFSLTLAASAWIQVRDGREETLVDAVNDIDVIASLSRCQART